MRIGPVAAALLFCVSLPLLVAAQPPAARNEAAGKPASGCTACHEGIEPIREKGSKMLADILDEGRSSGDPAGCVVCHGGDPKATEKEAAHKGPEFYPDPGSPWVNENTCGQCHPDHVNVQWHSLMMTEATPTPTRSATATR